MKHQHPIYLRVLIFVFLFLASRAYAVEITCPTVAEIKNNQLHGWLMLYESNEEQALDPDAEKFRQGITHLEVAKWNPYYSESAHCFYARMDDGSNKIILAHDAWRPVQSSDWAWVTKSLAECSAGESFCRFTS